MQGNRVTWSQDVKEPSTRYIDVEDPLTNDSEGENEDSQRHTQEQSGSGPQTPSQNAGEEPSESSQTSSWQRTSQENVQRYIDIAPFLRCLCGCLPCCCLYNLTDDDNDDDSTAASSTDKVGSKRRQIKKALLVNKNALIFFIMVFVQGLADALWRCTILSIFAVLLTATPISTDDSSISDPRLYYTPFFRYVGYFEGLYGFGKLLIMLMFPKELVDFSDQRKRGTSRGGNGNQKQTENKNKNFYQRLLCSNNDTPGQCLSFTLYSAGTVLVLTAVLNLILLLNVQLPDANSSAEDYHLFYQLAMPILLCYGISNTLLLSSSSSHSLLLRSVRLADHDKCKATILLLTICASVCGPLISIIIFGIMGNEYRLHTTRVVWIVGVVLEMVVGFMSFGLSEKYFLPDEEWTRGGTQSTERGGPPSSPSASSVSSSSSLSTSGGSDDEESDGRGTLEEPLLQQQDKPRSILRNKTAAINIKPKSIPCSHKTAIFLFLSSTLLISAGKALFHPYFPLFLKDVPQLPPIELQSLYLIAPILTMFFNDILQRCFELKKKGKARIVVVTVIKGFGAMCVLFMGTVHFWGDGNTENEPSSNNAAGMSALFLFYLVLINCTNMVETRAFSDYVVKTGLGKQWKQGIELGKTATWAACATVGGVLVEMHSDGGGKVAGYGSGDNGGGYGFVLKLVGYLEFAGVACLLAMLPFSPSSKSSTFR